MSRIESLLKAYEQFVAQPWSGNLSGAEKVWFAIYEPAQERRLIFRIPEFEVATRKAGHGWKHLDIANTFARWMGNQKYREAYFADPDALEVAMPSFTLAVASSINGALTEAGVDEGTVVAISGTGTLFGLTKTSAVIDQVVDHVRGRLLVFFPGRHENSRYRLLDARDGWNYLAVPIIGKNGG